MKTISNANKRQIDEDLFIVYDKKSDTITCYVCKKQYSHYSASKYRDELKIRTKYEEWKGDDGMLEWLNKVTS